MGEQASAPAGYARCLVNLPNDHLDRLFDYAIPAELDADVGAGRLVEVVFAGRKRRAVVVERVATTEVPSAKIRPLKRVLGAHVWLTPLDLEIVRWAAERYGASAGAVLSHVVPKRTVDVERRAAAAGWYPPEVARRPDNPQPPDLQPWEPYSNGGPTMLRTLAAGESGAYLWRPLAGESVGDRVGELVLATLAAGRDVVVLVPDPASSIADGVIAAVRAVDRDLVVDLRGGPSPRVAYKAWLRARCGQARVVVGERGAAFVPVHDLGLIVVADEANPAFKARSTPRHHVREVALERARRGAGVALLIGTVPSANAWRLLTTKRVVPVTAARAPERAAAPLVVVDDGAGQPRTRLLRSSVAALREAVAEGTYGVVLTARRGDGRVLVCARCGERRSCPTCASSVDPGPSRQVICEGCGWTGRQRTCTACGHPEVVPLAAGAERFADELRRTLPGTTVAVLEGYAAAAPPPPAVLVMTRGAVLDHPPGPVGAVVLPDIDGQLRRPVLEAAEDTLRLAVAAAAWTVVGRAGRGHRETGARPDVVVQSREPEHHVVRALVGWDPGGFWRAEVPHRSDLRFPPVAEAIRIEVVGEVDDLDGPLRDGLPPGDLVLGPRALEAGRWGYLLKVDDRQATVAALAPLRHAWSKAGRDVRVDVDPVDVT